MLTVKAEGNGPISAMVNALRTIDGIEEFVLDDYAEDSMGHSADAEAISFVRMRNGASGRISIGIGRNQNVVQSAAMAVISALNLLWD
jgi:2-isopropylmalate synthase